jgi:hypothetical protein
VDLAVHDVKIGAAHAASGDSNQKLGAGGLGQSALDQMQRLSRAIELHGG